MNTCATLELKPVTLRLVSMVADLQQYTGTVATVVVADLCGGWSVRTVRYYLAQAEAAGVLHRPRGVRSGWAVIIGASGGMVLNEDWTGGVRREGGDPGREPLRTLQSLS